MFGDQPSDDREDSTDDDADTDHWLSSLLALLDSIDRSSTPKRSKGSYESGIDLDYDLSIGTGLGSENPDRTAGHRSMPYGESTDSRDGPPSSRRPTRTRRRSTSSPQHVSTRTYDDERVVTMDVSGIDPDDITIGFDSSGRGGTELVVGVRNREIERIEVPWPRSSHRADARINNDVLTVTVTPEGSERDGRSESEPDSGGDSR